MFVTFVAVTLGLLKLGRHLFDNVKFIVLTVRESESYYFFARLFF